MVKMLDKEEELTLARAWLDHADSRARDKLLASYQPMIRRIARHHMRNGLDLDDLVQVGSMGFLAGLENFEPERGFSVGTLARFHIAAHIQLHVSEFTGIIRLPNSRRIKGLLSRCVGRIRFEEARVGRSLGMQEREAICVEAGFELAELEQYEMVMRPTKSLQSRAMADEDESGFEPVDDSDGPEEAVSAAQASCLSKSLIERLLSELPERTRTIIRMRHLSEDFVSLDAIAQAVGISRERVRRIEIEALALLRQRFAEAGIRDLSDIA